MEHDKLADPEAAVWSLPRLDLIEIEYATRDRFAEDDGTDPHILYTQEVTGDVVGVVFDDSETGEQRTPLGKLEVAVINLTEVGKDLAFVWLWLLPTSWRRAAISSRAALWRRATCASSTQPARGPDPAMAAVLWRSPRKPTFAATSSRIGLKGTI